MGINAYANNLRVCGDGDGRAVCVRTPLKAGSALELLFDNFVVPVLPIVQFAFTAFPVKMQAAPPQLAAAFWGTAAVTYMAVLVTIGGKAVHSTLRGKGRLRKLWSPKAGKYVHIDTQNLGPSVALTFGPYDPTAGFKFALPTAGLVAEMGHFEYAVGTFGELVHAVSSGDGVRITVVVAQHRTPIEGVHARDSKAPRRIVGYRPASSPGDTGTVPGLRNLV
eukprot:COSAG03_NODE_1122_length_4774_cov_59.335401_5_plen_222_part_00